MSTETDHGARMTPERLQALIEAYGAAPERWPEGERAAARALLGRSADARTLLAAASRLDGALDTVAPPAPSAALRGAVLGLGAARRARPRSPRTWRALPFARPAALAMAGALGIVFGVIWTSAGNGGLGPYETLDISLVAGGSDIGAVSQLMELDR